MKKKLLSLVLVATMALGLTACGGAAPAAAEKRGNIKVGIINNDPNESGYRTANVNDLKAKFTAENGYEASFAYLSIQISWL